MTVEIYAEVRRIVGTATAVLLFCLPAAASAATIAWTGAANTAWFNAANWSPAQVPTSADQVVIDLNGTVVVSGGTSIAFANLTLGDAAGTFAPTLRLSASENTGGSVTVLSRALIQQDTTQQIVLGAMSVLPGGMLTHTANSALRSAIINLSVAGNFNLQGGASINADGKGYAGGSPLANGSGPGAGIGTTGSGSGAGHGGLGGSGPSSAGGGGYDDLTNPADLGSGGGGAHNTPGGAGGGAVLIRVGGTFFLNGAVSANGSADSGSNWFMTGGGGGGGGAVNLTAAVLIGTGTIAANGGNGSPYGGGSGGGGRVAVVVTGSDGSNLNLQANTGLHQDSLSSNGGAGVIAFKTAGATNYGIIVGNLALAPQSATNVQGSLVTLSSITLNNSIVVFDAGSTVNLGALTVLGAANLTANNLVFNPAAPLEIRGGGALKLTAGSTSGGSLVVRNGGVFQQMNAQQLNFASVEVDSGGKITHAVNLSSRAVVVNMNVAGNFNLQGGAIVNVDGNGYAGGPPLANGSGPGAGMGTTGSGSGAGHGGQGGSAPSAAGGGSYDSLTNPTDLGSGGGGAHNTPGGAGGGAVLLQVGGTFYLNGTISANGGADSGSSWFMTGGGGGSGGSVNISAGILTGTGTASVNGGNGSPFGGAGGGGGRISLGGLTTLAITNSAAGGTGNGNGASGTINFIPPGVTDNANNLIVTAGTTYTLTGAHSYNVAIRVDGNLYVKAYDGTAGSGALSLSAPIVTVSSGGMINANAAGYAGGVPCSSLTSGSGPGGGGVGGPGTSATGALGAGGGGHIGRGGNSQNTNNGGFAYDNFLSPSGLGSGGGGGRSQLCIDGAGGFGGGSITVVAANAMTINGMISADGLPGHPAGGFNGDSGGGGGGGGSIALSANSLTGTGAVHANGGAGAASGGIGGGGGSGGTVAVTVAGNNTANLAVQANSGSGVAGSAAGGAGVIAIKIGSAANYDLIFGGLSNTGQAVTPLHGASLAFGTATFNNSSISFDTGSVVNVNSMVIVGTATLYAASISWGGNAEVRPGAFLQFAANSTQGGLLVDSAGTFSQINAQPLTLASVSVLPGGILTHAPNSATRISALNLNVSGDMTLPSGATISADGRGYSGAVGPGATGSGPGGGFGGPNGYAQYQAGFATGSAGAGGGHGGAGGTGGMAGGAANDSLLNPIDLGSGGGSSGNGDPGGNGGGAIILQVSGSLVLNGLVTASGMQGGSDTYYGTAGGGGSGGTINIAAANLAGSGALRANGGTGGVQNTAYNGGAGGGGRIALAVTGIDSSSLSVLALPGNGGGTMGLNGGSGVFAVKRPGTSNYSLTVGSSAVFAQADTPLLDSPLSLADVTLANSNLTFMGNVASADSLVVYGSVTLRAPSLVAGSVIILGTITATIGVLNIGPNPLEVRGGGRLALAAGSLSNCNLIVRSAGTFQQLNALPLNFASVQVDAGGRLTHAPNASGRTSVLNFNVAGNMNLQAGSLIAADGLGYSGKVGNQVGAGPGGGGTGGQRNGGGGGHGGAGGTGIDGSQGGPIYDSAFYPSDLGSQGGGSILGGGVGGGAGGGAVLLQVGGILTIDGTISANGLAGVPETYYGSGGGGGGGGTININAATVAGAGTLRADGGATTGSGGASGGGGRVALSYGTKTSSPVASVAAGNAGGKGSGVAGTILDNNQLVGFSNSNSTPTAALAQLTEHLSASQSLSETLFAQSLIFSGGTSTGVTPGTFSQAQIQLVNLQTGSFAGDGFFRGNWTLAFPSGDILSGIWQGAALLTSSRQMVLKGVIEGGIRGVLEGALIESVPGSGIFDRLSITCSATQVGSQIGASSLYFTASAPAPQTAQYPGTPLSLLQASLTGDTTGYSVGSLENTFTLLTVNSPGNPYNGEGFFLPTYSSTFGQGVGWAYAVSNYSRIAHLSGLYDQPVRALFEGVLVTNSPRSLLLTLERLDVGLPVQPILSVITISPHVATPGSIDSYLITIRNDGYAVALGNSIVAELPEYADFISATGNYVYYNVAHWWQNKFFSPEPFLRWDVAQVPPRSSITLSYQAKFRPATFGGPQAHGFLGGGDVELVSTSRANQVFAGYPSGGAQ